MADAAFTSQAAMQAATDGGGDTATSQLLTLVAFAPPATQKVGTSQLIGQGATEGRGVAQTSQALMLVAFRTGAPDNLQSRAWTFTFDGHEFYAVTLGEQGTWVYDLTTGQWSQWQTQGLTSWNMENGTTWRGDVVAADRQNPIIWRLDPTTFIDDDFKAQLRTVTGGLSVRNRVFVDCFAFRIAATVGQPDVENAAAITEPIVTLRYSDDQGRTFQNAGNEVITAGNFQQYLQWLSLGQMQAPMRIFEITDTGAVASIYGADAEVSQEEDA